jgi:hypothetical protein
MSIHPHTLYPFHCPALRSAGRACPPKRKGRRNALQGWDPLSAQRCPLPSSTLCTTSHFLQQGLLPSGRSSRSGRPGRNGSAGNLNVSSRSCGHAGKIHPFKCFWPYCILIPCVGILRSFAERAGYPFCNRFRALSGFEFASVEDL